MFRGNRWGPSLGRRMMSTEPTQLERTTGFFKDNRQAIINTVGMAYVFYYAIHNAKVQTAWDEREAEMSIIKAELDVYKSTLSDEKWLGEFDAKIRNGSSSKTELSKKFVGLFKEDMSHYTVSNDSTNTRGGGML